jgi:hypothetical protein
MSVTFHSQICVQTYGRALTAPEFAIPTEAAPVPIAKAKVGPSLTATGIDQLRHNTQPVARTRDKEAA